MANYLKKWVCECKAENWAYEFKCSCGKPRTKGVRWYTPKPMVEATAAQWAMKGSGPNWFCNYCGCENPVYNETNCGYCGAPIGTVETTVGRKGVKLSAFVSTAGTATAYETTKVEHGDAGWGIPEERREVPSPISRVQRNESSRMETSGYRDEMPAISSPLMKDRKKLIAIAGGVIGTVLFGLIVWLIWYWNFDTVTRTCWVQGFHWEQTLGVEEYQTFSKTDWASEMPSDAYNESCTYSFKEWKKVEDGTEEVDVQTTCDQDVPGEPVCDDDGAGGVTNCRPTTDTIQVPCTVKEKRTKYKDVAVHEDKCTYNVDRWVELNRYTTSGEDHFPYYYGEVVEIPNRLRLVQYPNLGIYSVYFGSEYVDPFSRNYDLTTWSLFQPEQSCQVEVNRRNNVVGSPQP